MSNVNLAIGGRHFTVACAKGEEAHVSDLGDMINAKISSMGDFSGQNESRMLLFAALLLADEVHSAHRQTETSASPALADGQSEHLAHHLTEIAERLENLAARLEA